MVVVDTSVVYKWFSTEDEQWVEQARELLREHLEKRNSIIAPDIILYELANAWATKTKLPSEKINTYFGELRNIDITIEPITIELVTRTAAFSKEYTISVYDAVYIVLAKEKKCDLYTADAKLVGKVKLSFAKYLSAYTTTDSLL